MAIEPLLVNCDLCVLAYQIYHQSTIWPLDPWYEILANDMYYGRERFMKGVHRLAPTLQEDNEDGCYGGPANARGFGDSNTSLDPIMTNYKQIDPRQATWNGDGEVFLAMKAPGYITDTIRKVRIAYYTGEYAGEWNGVNVAREVIRDYGAGQDRMIAFEGGTGSWRGTEAAWSLMGFVLRRVKRHGRWDAHIVFRGSRSGKASRALGQGLNGPISDPKGNPDWVTDMGSKLTQDDDMGGVVAEGFAAALKRCWPTILSALRLMNRNHGAPASIQIAGHSLGGALAAMCCGSIALGRIGEHLREEFPEWPWHELRGYFYAVPPIGSLNYVNALAEALPGQLFSPYIAGDMVVECSNSVGAMKTSIGGKVGWVLGGGGHTPGLLDRMSRPPENKSDENSHELYLIRRAIVRKYCSYYGGDTPRPLRKATPWATFATFADMLNARSISSYDGDEPNIVNHGNLREILQTADFSQHFTIFLDLVRQVVSNKKSYGVGHLDKSYAQANQRFALALEMCNEIEEEEPEIVADTVATQVAAILGYSMEKEFTLRHGRVPKQERSGAVVLKAEDLLGSAFDHRIGLGLILRAFEDKEQTTIEDFAAFIELEDCLATYLGNIEAWQKKASKKKSNL